MRKVAREVAFKLIFEYLFLNTKNDFSNCEIIEVSRLDENDKQYLEKIYNGVIDNLNDLKTEIQKYSIGYNVERIYKIDISILLLSTYEILHMQDIPKTVSINEAVELSKIYSTKKSSGFINGILGNVGGRE